MPDTAPDLTPARPRLHQLADSNRHAAEIVANGGEG